MSAVLHANVEALGWSLLHFLWQGTVVAVVLGVILHAVRKRDARVRYVLAGAGFLIMLGTFAVTLTRHWQRADRSNVSSSITGPGLSRAPEDPEPITNPISLSPGPVGASSAMPIVRAAELPPTAAHESEPLKIPRSERIRTMLPWLVGLWLVGVAFFSLRLLAGWLRIRRMRAKATEVTNSAWKTRFAGLRERLRISRPVSLLSSSTVAVPVVIGWLKPAILVPAGLFVGLSAQQLEAILAHELAHIRRHDFLVNLLQIVAETLFFYHPAVWWISTQLRKEREHCCDDVASVQCGDAIEYARALTALEELRGHAPIPSIAATDGSLLGRVRRLLGVTPSTSRVPVSWPVGVAVSLLVVCLVAGVHLAEGKPPEKRAGGAADIAPTVRGLSLLGIPSTPKSRVIPEIHEETRDGAGSHLFKPGVFTMSIDGEDGNAQMIYPPARVPAEGLAGFPPTRFYVQFDDRIYGPILGDPMKKLKLVEILKRQLSAMDSNGITQRLWEMLRHWDGPIFMAACEVIPKIEWNGYGAIMIYLEKEMPHRREEVAAAGLAALKHLEALPGAAWQRIPAGMRGQPSSSGRPVDRAPPWIQWGEPNDLGLRLGISVGLPDAEIRLKDEIPMTLYIRNDGDEKVKLDPSRNSDDGMRAWLTDSFGMQHPLVVSAPSRKVIIHLQSWLDSGHFLVLTRTPRIRVERDGVAPLLIPGKYTFRVEKRIAQWAGFAHQARMEKPERAPGFDAWEGILTTLPVELNLAPGDDSVDAAASNREQDLGRWKDSEARPRVPDKEYKNGKPIAEADKAIIWNEPNEAGLRLGMSKVTPDAEHQSGRVIPCGLYVRNDGTKPVKFSNTGYWNQGIRGWLVDSEGVRHPYHHPLTFFPAKRYRLEPGHFVELDTEPFSGPSFTVKPGRHTLRMEAGIGWWLGGGYPPWMLNEPRYLPGVGEWIGTLVSAPMEVQITPPPPPKVRIARAGDTVLRPNKVIRIAFEENRITLAGRDGKPKALPKWTTPTSEWKVTGDYVAAWQGSPAKIWVVDTTGIQLLNFGPADPPNGGWRDFWTREIFVDGGHWTMEEAEAGAPLGGIPERVRAALKLPAKA